MRKMKPETLARKRLSHAMRYLFDPHDDETECPRCYSRFKSALGVNIHWNKKHKRKRMVINNLRPRKYPTGYWDTKEYREKMWARFIRRTNLAPNREYAFHILPDVLEAILS